MLETYQWLLRKCKEIQLRHSRGYAILDRMNNTLEVMKQKKKDLREPNHELTQAQLISSNISYFLNIIAQ